MEAGDRRQILEPGLLDWREGAGRREEPLGWRQDSKIRGAEEGVSGKENSRWWPPPRLCKDSDN